MICLVLSSSVVGLWWAGPHGWLAAVGSNTYVWISLGLGALLVPPARLHADSS